MNKTHRRAIQKHRAKKLKIALRRKMESSQQAGGLAHSRGGMSAASAGAQRMRSGSRRRNEEAGGTESESEG